MPADISAADRERGARVLYVHMLLQQQRGNEHVSLEEFGRLVAVEQSKLGAKVSPFSPSSVSRWQSGEAEPDGITFRAMSKVVKGKVGPGWIHYGADSAAGPKEIDHGMMATIAATRASGRRGPRG